MPPSPTGHVYYGGSPSYVPAYAQLPQYAQPQQLGASSIYGQPNMAQYAHPAQHQQPQARMGSCGGQLSGKHYAGQGKAQYTDYQLQAGGYPFGGSPYGASSGGVNSAINLPSSLAGMAGGYPPTPYADQGGYNNPAAYGGYDGLSPDFHAPQGMYMQGPQQGMFPPGHNGI